jgi:hypothetical protein
MNSNDLREVTQLAGEDRRATRILVGAAADAQRAEQERAAADAAADRELRLASGLVDVDAKRRAARRTEQTAIAAQRRAERAARRTERQGKAAARRAWMAARVDYVRHNAPAVYSTVVYAAAVGSAVYGQVTAATGRGWPLLVGLGGATAIEGLALSMALTAHQLRLAGERAVAPRVLTWVATLAAAAINYFGHVAGGRTGAVILAGLSVIGIVVWEIRSGRKHRATLRQLGLIPDPPARFGWRRWVRFPFGTLAAWSRDVRDRVSPQAADVLAAMAVDRAERDRTRRVREVARVARAELAAARKRGDGAAVVAALVRLAAGDDHGAVPGDGPSSPARYNGRGAALVPGTETDIPQVTAGASGTRVRAYVGTGVDGAQVGTDLGTDVGAEAGPYRPADVGTDVPGHRPARVAAAARPSRRSSVRASASTDRPQDVAALLPAGAAVQARLAAAGRALTRDALLAGLREDGHTVSSARASALYAALRATPDDQEDSTR